MKKKIIIICSIILFLGLAVGGYLYFKKDNTQKVVESDAVKFAKEYTTITDDNVFVYKTLPEIIKILEKGTGVVYLGFPECPWCQAYVKYLNDYAKEEGITKIYYYDILEDRKNNTEEYQKVVKTLKKYLESDEEGEPRIYVPNVTFVANGKIVGNDLETAKDTHNKKKPEEYWTKDEVKDLETRLKGFMKKVLATNTCTDCNKD